MAKGLLDKDIAIMEIPQKGGPFVIVSKKYLLEVRAALEAIISGEKALRSKKTRSFKEFISKEFPAYVKNL